MKRVMSVVLGVAVMAAAGAQGAAPGAATQATRPAAAPVPASLGSAMGEMGRMINAVKQEAADPAKRDAALQHLGILERDVAIAKNDIPPLVEAKTGDEKAKGAAEYRATMISLMRALLDLEEAVAAGKVDAVAGLLEKVGTVENKGHDKFMSPFASRP